MLTFIISFIVAFVMVKIYDIRRLHEYFRESPIIRGVVVGVLSGLLFFIVTRLTGYSFNTTGAFKHTLVDILWQVFEQTIGGIVIGIVFIFQYHPEPED
ncbi:MAG: hypothetical protein WCP52_00570 [Bacteroidota bacterium]